MKKMIIVSLISNVVVLIPVCAGLLVNASWAVSAYGIDSPARGILLSTYAAILVVSIGLLFRPDPKLAAPLLLVQVIYKLTTPFTVHSFANPVVISNIAIAALHLATLGYIQYELSGNKP
jgi:hypothetical protein